MLTQDKKDLIIIGAGLNGLAAGLAYALNNDLSRRKVLIVEKNPTSGGYMTTFNRRGFQFDTCQMISNVTDILSYFGIGPDCRSEGRSDYAPVLRTEGQLPNPPERRPENRLEFLEFTRDFIQVFKVEPATGSLKTFSLYSGGKAFEEQFRRLFPAESARLKRFFDYSEAMFHEIYGLKYKPGPLDVVKMLFGCPKVLRNMNKTFAQYLKMFGIDNPDINLLFQVFSSMCGLPNDRVAALLTVGVMYSLREKACRPQGPFRLLPEKMEQRYRALGGEILFKSEVEKILVEKGSVSGISLKDGTQIQASTVISTADVQVTLEKMVGLDVIRELNPRYARKVNSIRMTTSSFIVSLGIDDAAILNKRQLAGGYTLLTSGVTAFSALFDQFEGHSTPLTEDCFFISLACPPAREQIKPVLIIQSIPQAPGRWTQLRETDRLLYNQEKEKSADLLIDIVEKYLIPELRQHIVFKDVATPATFARYSGSPSGSIYDMASTPENFGARRLPITTPVRGLLLPKFAHGAFGALNSGLQAVDVLMKGQVMNGNSRFALKSQK
jgi:all-trans-retinol 13,14-reductase